GSWEQLITRDACPKQEVLRLWDESTEKINMMWPQIPARRFNETMTAFGQYPGRVYDLLLYAIDNEIHHRGQGYVYLRVLGIEPPHFYEREESPASSQLLHFGWGTFYELIPFYSLDLHLRILPQ